MRGSLGTATGVIVWTSWTRDIMSSSELLTVIVAMLVVNLTWAVGLNAAEAYREKCRTDYDCFIKDANLECATITNTCRCRRGLNWDVVFKKCYRDEDTYAEDKFNPVKDLIIPGIIVMTIGAMVYLGIKLFCNWCLLHDWLKLFTKRAKIGSYTYKHPNVGVVHSLTSYIYLGNGKLWRRRRRRPDLTRELEEPPHQATWVASYRVFSSMNGVETRSSPVLSPSSSFPTPPHPLHGALPAEQLPRHSLSPVL
uniref:Uncharacterized protein n=1 Tax=Timema poppense TaxID=170557 RepID=A0A7R9GYW2_TIMPO|nr:unnamed protein product [Timema poppensis]